MLLRDMACMLASVVSVSIGRVFLMRSKVFLFFLLSGALCAGQSVLTTPVGITQSAPANPPAAGTGTGAGAAPSTFQGFAPVGGLPAPGAIPSMTQGASNPGLLPVVSNPTRIAGPLTTRSDFEKFAEDATGLRLPVYGRQLFDEVPTTFAPVENVPVPADYVLGPGDQLLIRAWGKIDLDSRVTVDRNGQIYLPRVGTLTVGGLHYAQVDGYLRSAIGAIFKDFELNVSLGQLRSIQVFVLGYARQPGVYTVSSLSTLVDAIFTCGGPSATGSMRHILLRRGGKILTDFDVYDLVERGDKSHDVRLLPGDVIYFSPIGPQVAISGDVNTPGVYELKGKTTVGTALQFAGGVTSLANTERAVLERIEDHSSREVEEFPLDASGQARLLRDGDLLQVFPISPKIQNAVTLRGNVAQPGVYAWKQGMRVSDLIPSRDFLITRRYWNTENHLVPPISSHPFGNPQAGQYGNPQAGQYGNPQAGQYGNPQAGQYGNPQAGQYGNPQADQYGNPQAVPYGGAQVGPSQTDPYGYALTDQFGNPQTDANGNVQAGQFGNAQPSSYGNSPGSPYGNLRYHQFGPRIPIIDTVGKNSAEINWEYALIERLDERDLSTHLIPFHLAAAIDDPASADNKLLKPGDVVTIFSSADLALPMAKHALFVRIGGEVNAPGVYRMKPGDTLRELVQKAGGLTPHSYLFASIFTRVSTRLAEEKELKQAAQQMQQELSSKYASSPPTMGQTATDQQSLLQMQQAAVRSISEIQPTGRIVLDIKPAAATLKDIPDLPLEDGDTFYIPPSPDTVQVNGSVYNANAFRYSRRKRLRDYLDAAGGPTREADKKRTFVIRADGMVVSQQNRGNHTHGNFAKLVMFPGDTVIVPQRFKTTSSLVNFANYAQIASGAAMTALTMGYLIP